MKATVVTNFKNRLYKQERGTLELDTIKLLGVVSEAQSVRQPASYSYLFFNVVDSCYFEIKILSGLCCF